MNYREEIETIYGWPISDRQYQIMKSLAHEYNSGSLILDQWRIFQSENKCKSVDVFCEWIKDRDIGPDNGKQEEKKQGSLFGRMPWEK